MHAALRSFTMSPDPRSLPIEPADFAVDVRFIAGPADGSGEESFDLTVCTPEWLARQAGSGFYPGRHHLVVNFELFSVSALQTWIESKVSAVSGDTWAEVGERLGRWAYWEFEDYTH
ncbi:hypothetical protein GGQ22_11610 [Nocardioides sp. zg-579]|uniref:Immunity protein 8 of polymorphic toxin system n=1 Tax=Nocardioides marmotae TaxID=2663857 RepID=A0A6I3JCG7_9ACTN|nr:Imm8 family immunity protein [Nocardioides marmotae]MCR6032088.1 hypothetical protein [Gordonia jinghuaiqii]MTB95733.1 hypothetical protein [Nocardioides marmotae]QKE01132.1 hypothetical protein HPC71_08670 [Nocardioides marmotae]